MNNYSSEEMLALWRRELGYDTRRNDCSVSVYEGIDIDDMLRRRIRAWYLGLLDTADPALVPTDDFAVQAIATPLPDGGSFVALPDGARRPLAVMLDTWSRPVAPVSPDDAAPRLGRMASPYGQPGRRSPLAVAVPGGIRCYPSGRLVMSLLAVSDPGPDTYILDDTLLPDFLKV